MSEAVIEARQTRVVVVGAGFAGIAATRELLTSKAVITLVDGENFHTFQPLLYQVATAGLEPGDVAFPVRTIFWRAGNVAFVHGWVTNVDTAGRAVILTDGTRIEY